MPIRTQTANNKVMMYRGDNHTITVTVKKKTLADPTVLTPMDVTGGSCTLTVKTRAADVTVVLTKAGYVADGPNGKFQVDLVPLDTASLEPLLYSYDVEVILLGGAKYTVVVDLFELRQDVTP